MGGAQRPALVNSLSAHQEMNEHKQLNSELGRYAQKRLLSLLKRLK